MAELLEVYKIHPVDNHLIAPLDFGSIKDLPETHAWVETSSDDLKNKANNKELEPLSIPLLDLEDPDVLEHICHACESWGLFQFTNHGVSMQLLKEVESQVKKLFSLPFEQKMRVVRSPDGATGYGCPRITPFFSKLMWNEGFTIMGSSFVDHAKQLWPNEHQGFCDVIDEYQEAMKVLADKLMHLILKSLNIPKSALEWLNYDPTHYPKKMSTALQLNSYPSCADPNRTMGLAPHTDTFLFTFIHQSGNVNGLQVFKDNATGWVSVAPVPGALVVNVGDLLHIISNARFRSVLHRAVVSNAEQRISVAYFYGPPLDFQVSPFLEYPACKGPCFRSLAVKEYVSIKSKHLDSALTLIKN